MKNEEQNTLVEILKAFDTCMLVSTESRGWLTARPMRIARIDSDLKIWFLTNINSGQVGDFLNDSHALITAQKDHSAYISLTGVAHALQSETIAKELWGSAFDAWFPQGPSDPDLTLIEFEPLHGEYWDSRGLKRISYAVEVAKAFVTGDSPHLNESNYHGKVTLDKSSKLS